MYNVNRSLSASISFNISKNVFVIDSFYHELDNLVDLLTYILVSDASSVDGEKMREDLKNKPELYSRNLCDFVSEKFRPLEKHKKQTHEAPLQCDQCEYTNYDKVTLKRHKVRVHSHKRYSCDQCDYSAQKHI